MTEPTEQELRALNEDKEPWLQPGYSVSRALLSEAVLALKDVEIYCDMATKFEAPPDRTITPHGIHSLMHEALRCAQKSHQHCVLVLPPEHGKTSQVEKFIVWQIAQRPHMRVAMVSYSEKTAKKNLSHARKTLISPLTQNMWPHIKPDVKRSIGGGGWSSEHLYLEGMTDPAVMAYSLLSDCQGQRFDLVWLDDAIVREMRFSEAMRIEAHAAIHETWLKRITDNGLCIITNNCWHDDDSIHRATKSKSFLVLWIGYVGMERFYYRVHHPPECWSFPVTGTLPLWKVWPKSRLELTYESDKPAYRRQFNQQASVADEMRLPAPETWKTYKPEELPRPETGARAFAYLDPAGGKYVERGDYAAMVLGILSREKIFYVLDVWCKRCPPAEQIEVIWKAHCRLKAAGWPGLHQAWYEVLPKEEEWIDKAIAAFKGKILRDHPSTDWPRLYHDYPSTHCSKAGRIENLHTPLDKGDIRFSENFIGQRYDDTPRGHSIAIFLRCFEDFGSKGCAHDDPPDATEGCWRKALAIGPGKALPGSGIVGPREQGDAVKGRSLEFAKGTFTFDAKKGRIVVKKPARRFI